MKELTLRKIDFFKKAIESNPNEFQNYINIAELYKNENNLMKSKEYYQRALEFSKSNTISEQIKNKINMVTENFSEDFSYEFINDEVPFFVLYKNGKVLHKLDLYPGYEDYFIFSKASFYSTQYFDLLDLDDNENYVSPIDEKAYSFSEISIDVSSLYKRVIVKLPDGFVFIWDLNSSKLLGSIKDYNQGFLPIVYDNKIIFFPELKGKVHIFSIFNGNFLRKFYLDHKEEFFIKDGLLIKVDSKKEIISCIDLSSF